MICPNCGKILEVNKENATITKMNFINDKIVVDFSHYCSGCNSIHEHKNIEINKLVINDFIFKHICNTL